MSKRQEKRIQKKTPNIDKEQKACERNEGNGFYIGFFYDSKLTDAEKEEIRAWANSLPPRHAAMLNLVIEEVRAQTDFDCYDQIASQDESY